MHNELSHLYLATQKPYDAVTFIYQNIKFNLLSILRTIQLNKRVDLQK